MLAKHWSVALYACLSYVFDIDKDNKNGNSNKRYRINHKCALWRYTGHHDTPGSPCLVPSTAMLWGPLAVWLQVCSKQSGMMIACWLFVVRPTTVGMLRAMTSSPAKGCRRTPIATYETYHHVLTTGRSSGGMYCSFRAVPGRCLYTYQQEQTALIYVYLKRWLADDGVHTEPLHLWIMQPAHPPHPPACLPMIWPPPPSWTTMPPMHDLWLQWLFHLLLTGCSGSGKYTLINPLVVLSSHVLMRMPTCILLFYNHI